jgi:hypothetical protein
VFAVFVSYLGALQQHLRGVAAVKLHHVESDLLKGVFVAFHARLTAPRASHLRQDYEIEEGYFGAIRLDGLRAALITSWPGAIHEGNGTMQVIIDDRSVGNWFIGVLAQSR